MSVLRVDLIVKGGTAVGPGLDIAPDPQASPQTAVLAGGCFWCVEAVYKEDSAIFYADEEQRRVAEAYIQQLDASGVLGAPIATRLEPHQPFYRAESYHQDYAARNPSQPYIVYTSAPKVAKLRKQYPDRLKVRDVPPEP